LMKAVDVAIARGGVDTTRLGVAGGSYGGFMTNWVVGHTRRFAAAETDRSIYDWYSWYGSSDAQGLTDYEFSGPPWDADSLYRVLSPMTYAKSIRTPLLIVHSEDDRRTPITDGEQLFVMLRKRGVPAEFVRYPRSYHGLSRTGPPWLLVDRRLADWPALLRYYQALAKTSDRVRYRELGKSTLGAPFVALLISSPQNLKSLDRYRQLNARLADPRTIRNNREAQEALRDGRAIVLITSGIHSNEVGGHLTPAILAYRLASDTTAATRTILDNVILLLVPSLNPDGVSIVTRWYNRTLGTPAEGTDPPELYHHYTGHDNNRDWYAFTQVETQLVVDSLHNVWHPEIVHDIHQQDSDGSRLFLPPYLDPVEPNVDPLLVDGVNALGASVAWQLAGEGKPGIAINAIYDAWTPARAYQHYHGGV